MHDKISNNQQKDAQKPKIKALALTAAGFILLALGAIGVFLPVLPTTPFILLAVTCFSFNPTMQQHILKIKFINEYVTNYKQHSGLKMSTLVISLVFLWVSIGISMIFSKTQWHIIMLLSIGIAVSIHIIFISRPRK